MSSDDEKDVIEDLRNPDVVTKYKTAAQIANKALELVIKEAVAGKKVVELCDLGDKYITEETGKLYNKSKAKIEKGIGFPTCISVNHVVGHFSPLAGNADVLKEGDLVKVDLGAQIDGYCTVVAHSFVIPKAGATGPVTGRQADVLLAAHTAAEAALRLLKPGHKNTEVTEMIASVATDFKVNAVAGVLSHEMSRYIIDGDKVIINKADHENKVEEVTFEPNQVWAIDIVMSTGEGKAKESEERTTVYKRDLNASYQLKMKTARTFFGDVQKRFPAFPFSLRAFEEKTARLGLVECVNHNLLNPYPVLHEKEGEYVAHFKFTALILPSGPNRATGLPVDVSKIQSELSLQNDKVKDILRSGLSTSAKKKKKVQKKKEETAGAAPDLVAADA